MDPRLSEAVARNDKNTFINLVEENENFLEQRTADSRSTVLHLASRFGHIELVKEILKLRPMVDAENIKLETPLHEACRHGHTEVLKLLLETNPAAACKLNADNQSAFFVACSNGHLDVVKILLNQSWLVGLEDEGLDSTCLHVAASRGHKDVVGELLNVCPGVARTFDKNGYSPLHYACYSGHLEMTRILLLCLGVDIALQFSSTGYMPLHLAAMNGKTEIFEEFERIAPISFHHVTRQGETIFHLSVKYKHYDAFMWLVGAFHDTDLFHRTDQLGNTLLHLAVSRGCSQMVAYLINKTTSKINSENNEGLTALDILDQAERTDKFPDIKDMLEKSGGRKGAKILCITNEIGDPSNKGTNSEVNSLHHQVEEANEIQDDKTTKPESSPKKTTSALASVRRQKRLSGRRREELTKFYNDRRNKRHDIHREALQNARNTIILVAILIATVTFAAGMNPPRVIYQEEQFKGNSTAFKIFAISNQEEQLKGNSTVFKAFTISNQEEQLRGNSTAFKVFTISNNLALFTSLCIVIILVSIIPFQRKQLMRLLVITHKVMWAAVSFMAISYVAATWILVPHRPGTKWLFVALLVICAATMGTVFLYLGHALATHWLMKLKWRKNKGKKGGIVAPPPSEGKIQPKSVNPDIKLDIQSRSSNADIKDEARWGQWPSQSNSSTNSDISSSMSRGFHPY